MENKEDVKILGISTDFQEALSMHQARLTETNSFKAGYKGLQQKKWYLSNFSEEVFIDLVQKKKNPKSRFYELFQKLKNDDDFLSSVLVAIRKWQHLYYDQKIDRSFEEWEDFGVNGRADYSYDRFNEDSAIYAFRRILNRSRIGDNELLIPMLQSIGMFMARPSKQPIFDQMFDKPFPRIPKRIKGERVYIRPFPYTLNSLPNELNDLVSSDALNSIYKHNYWYKSSPTKGYEGKPYRALEEHCQLLMTVANKNSHRVNHKPGYKYTRYNSNVPNHLNPYFDESVEADSYGFKEQTEESLFKPVPIWDYKTRMINGEKKNVAVLKDIWNLGKAPQAIMKGEIFSQDNEMQSIELILNYAEINAHEFNGDDVYDYAKKGLMNDAEVLEKAEKMLSEDLAYYQKVSEKGNISHIDISILKTKYGLKKEDLTQDVIDCIKYGQNGIQYIF